MTAAMTDHDGALDLSAAAGGLVADGSPGGIGSPETWLDADRLECLAWGYPGHTLVNCAIAFRCNETPVTYTVISRRWSLANGGRPYYVLAWPD